MSEEAIVGAINTNNKIALAKMNNEEQADYLSYASHFADPNVINGINNSYGGTITNDIKIMQQLLVTNGETQWQDEWGPDWSDSPGEFNTETAKDLRSFQSKHTSDGYKLQVTGKLDAATARALVIEATRIRLGNEKSNEVRAAFDQVSAAVEAPPPLLLKARRMNRITCRWHNCRARKR